jgi:hypothetical protein
MLPKEAIQEFKRIYAKIYKVDLTDEEAARRANNLIALYKAVYGNPQLGRIEDNKEYSDTDKNLP